MGKGAEGDGVSNGSRMVLERDEIVAATAEMIRRFPWHLFVTLTTRDHVGPEVLAKRYCEYVRRIGEHDLGLGLGKLPMWRGPDRLRHVVAWELQRRSVWHLHALWGAPGALQIHRGWAGNEWNRLCVARSRIVDEVAGGVHWLVTPDSDVRGKREFELAGIAKVELIRSTADVAAYCAKYVAKDGVVDLHGLGS